MSENEIVVTGLGVVTPIGDDVESFWESNLLGRSGLRRDDRMDLSGLPGGWVAGLVDDDARARVLARSGVEGRTWCDVLLHDAVDQALADAGLPAGTGGGPGAPGTAARPATAVAGPVGLVWSRVWPGPTGSSPDDYAAYFAELGRRAARPDAPPEITDRTALPAEISARLGVPLVATRIEATCAGGVRAIAEGARLLRLGLAELVVVCASVSRNTPYVLSQYAQLMASSRWRGAPEGASMPFDRRRCGMVVNESSGAMVLETAAHARARGVTSSYATIGGWGLALGTGHVTAPAVDEVERVMRTAIASAGATPDEVDTVNAHGTSTKLNDLVEAQAIHRVFGARTPQVEVSAVKSLTGHGSAASGVVESVAAALTVCRGAVPPVVTCTEPDPACAVTTTLEPVYRRVTVVVKNAFGFGGQYASLTLRRPPVPRPVTPNSAN